MSKVMPDEVYVFPLSFAQQRLWFMDQLTPGTAFFNLNTVSRLRMPINVPVLERSLNEIVHRHESLRTTFAVVEGQPVQAVAASLRLALPLRDLRGLSPIEREREAERLANEEAQRPFDLARGPLVRTTLLRLDEEDYVFLLTMHHIVSDGWSMGIFWKELSAVWSAYAVGRPSPLAELPIQYADFAVWQRKWLQGDILSDQLSYWKRKLDRLPVLQLPTTRPRPALQTFNGAIHPITIPAALTAALRELSKREGATLFMTLLAAFQTLLYRYSNQDDVVVGSYIAGRNRAEIEGLIGFFLNTLVMRTDLSGAPSFRELLQRVRRTTLEAYAHQDVPFAKLVEELQPERDLSRNPLFQVMFQLLNVPTLEQKSTDSDHSNWEVQRGTSNFDISCMIVESAEGLGGDIEYNTDLFDHETIVRLAQHYQTLLESIVAEPDLSISDLRFVHEAEERQLLVEWNATERYFARDRSLVQMFETLAEQRPSAVAFICGDQELSYVELNRRANRIAHYLLVLGVGPEVLVGVCLERSLDQVAGLLGVLKAGGVYLPLDPSYPRDRLASIVEDARVRLILTRDEFALMFEEYSARVVSLDCDGEIIALQSEDNPCVDTGADNLLAYAIYTSGSTGQPKGVEVEHAQVLNRFDWMWTAYPFEAHEVCCQKTALNFVDSIWELLGPLLRAVPSVIIPESTVKDPYALVRTLAGHRVTRIWLVPSLLRLMLDAYPDLQEHLPDLKFWVTSGEALSSELLKRFQEAMPRCVLYNLYGTSEVWDATWYEPPEHGGDDSRHVPIGRPINNVEVYVLDSRLHPVPIGVPGQLYIGGVGLARSYRNRPELTAEKFIPHPFSARGGARLYWTGDLVRYRPDGQIEFLGRIDHQVKLRGFRIEPGEVEAVLRQHSDVQEAVVKAREIGPGDTRLAAYLVERAGGEMKIEELRGFLREKLPEYMIPSAFVKLESLPLMPNGKLDRQALPDPEGLEVKHTVSYVAPATGIERTIVEVWQEVLHRDKVGINDNFFDLGGHSLLMFQVFTRLRAAFNREFSMNDLFRYPTISSLAKYFGQEQRERPSLSHVQDRVRKQREILSQRQQALKGKVR